MQAATIPEILALVAVSGDANAHSQLLLPNQNYGTGDSRGSETIFLSS